MALLGTTGTARRTGVPAGVRTRGPWTRWLPLAFSAVAVTFFLIWPPHDNDLLAAYARASAASHGVGLTYWFSWFAGGTSPGQYSLVTAYLCAWVGTLWVAGLIPFLGTLLTYRAAQGLERQVTVVWVVAVALLLNQWSGRVAFGLGTLSSLVVWIGMRERRHFVTAMGALLTAAASPVSGALVVIVLVCVGAVDRTRRATALVGCVCAGGLLLAVAAVFGQPPAQPYSPAQAAITFAITALMLLARPSRVVSVLLVVSAVVALALLVVHSGLGANYSRLAWVCLPGLVAADSRASGRLLALAVCPALLVSGFYTAQGLIDSRQPAETYGYYRPLATELHSLPDLHQYRLEVVQNGSVHMDSFALLPSAMLARGWETQADGQYDAMLVDGSPLSAHRYRSWIDHNAVGYVALTRTATDRTPEHELVSRMRPGYLHEVWSDADWILYRVTRAQPIADRPQTVTDVSQSTLSVRAPAAGSFVLRVHFSRFLEAHDTTGDDATLTQAGAWTRVRVPAAGDYTFQGKF